MGLFSELFDGVRDFLHPSIDEGFRILMQECESEVRQFCRIRDYDLNNLSFNEKESIFNHRISIKIDSIRKVYQEVESARKRYPDGFDSLFVSLFSQRMATDKDCTAGKIDTDYQVFRDRWGRLNIPVNAGVSLGFYTYTKDFVERYYSLLYSDGEFSKYVYEGDPSFDNFQRHLSRIFRIKEVPTSIEDLSLEHVRLLHKNLDKLPVLHQSALLEKRYKEEIENNPQRKEYLTQFLGSWGIEFGNKEYIVSHISELDSYIRELLRQECEKIKKYYPAGYAYYCRHNSSFNLAKIIEAKDSIRSYNQYGNLCEPYDRWEKEQLDYTKWCKGALAQISPLLSFSEVVSTPEYKRLLVNGTIGDLEYKVSSCSFFPICNDSSLEYSVLESYKNYYEPYYQSKIYYSKICDSRYYEALDSFIGQLADKYSKSILVIVLPTDSKNADIINTREFSGVRKRCAEKRISILDLAADDESASSITGNDITKFKHILLLDSLLCKNSVERMLSLFADIDDYHPAIFSISSLYEVSSDTMREKITRRKREIELEKQRQEEERRRLERERIEHEKQAAIERARQETIRKKQEEDRRLYDISHRKKACSSQIKAYLDEKGVRYFYHFTDKQNLASIKKHGGLYSWYYCQEKEITINKPGGSAESRIRDRSFGLEDYVRLSFCNDHPMTWRLQQDGYDLAYLKINVDVALLDETLFSDVNAASSSHHHGGTFDDLKRVDIYATRKTYVRRTDPDFHKHQAEVMVRTFIPLEYIMNLKEYDSWLQ